MITTPTVSGEPGQAPHVPTGYDRDPPPPPERIATVAGHTHYYRYLPSLPLPPFEVASGVGARRGTHELATGAAASAHDGSARPMWLALRQALIDSRVTVHRPQCEPTRFGIRIMVQAPPQGPRSAPAISEALVDGAIVAFHAGAAEPSRGAVLTALAHRIPGVPVMELARLVRHLPSISLFDASPFAVHGARVQISPSDERWCEHLDAARTEIRLGRWSRHGSFRHRPARRAPQSMRRPEHTDRWTIILDRDPGRPGLLRNRRRLAPVPPSPRAVR